MPIDAVSTTPLTPDYAFLTEDLSAAQRLRALEENKQTYSKEYLDYLASLSPDFDAADQDVAIILAKLDASATLGLEAQMIIVDLVRILAKIRKEQKNIAHTQAANSFRTANLVADHQKASAKNKFTADIVNGAAGVVGGLIDIGSAGVSMAAMAKQNSNIMRAADAQDWSRPNAGGTNAPSRAPQNTYEAPPAYDTPDGEIRKVPLGDDTLPGKNGKVGGGTDAPDTPDATAMGRDIDVDARTRFISDQQRIATQKVEFINRLVSSLGQMLSSVMRMGAAHAERESGEDTAKATIERAFQEWLDNQRSMSDSYERDMREWINKIFELIKSIESNRHRSFENQLV